MTPEALISVVDDDVAIRKSMRALLESAGFRVRDYESAKSFLTGYASQSACLITDVRMPDMDGLEFLEEINRRSIGLPVIIMTGHGDVPLAVRAMQAGAINFIEKPFDGELMLDNVRKVLAMDQGPRDKLAEAKSARAALTLLTPRELRVLEQLVAGQTHKIAAFNLGISSRTIETHRGHIMHKLKARNLPDLVRITLAAAV